MFEKIGGYIEYYGVTDWWNENFSKEQRKYIREKTKNSFDLPIDSGKIKSSTQNGRSYFSNLAYWFNTKKDIDIAKKLILKADEFPKKRKYDVLSLFLYYSNRDLLQRS